MMFPCRRPVLALVPLLALVSALAHAGPIVPTLSFTNGADPSASGASGYSAVRYRNFANSNGANGTVYIGLGGDLGGGGPRGTNQNVPWSSQTYDFTYTYDPVQKMAATTWRGQTTGTTNVSYQPLATIPALPANEMTVLVRNTRPGDLILTLSRINSVGLGGVLSGSNGGTIVTGGTVTLTSSTWNGASTFLTAYLADSTLFNEGFQLFGTVAVGSPTNSTNYGNNEGSKFEINLAYTSSVPVPEPASSVMLLGGIGLGVWQVSRRRRPRR